MGLRRLRPDGGTSVAQPMHQPRLLDRLVQLRLECPQRSNAHRSRKVARWCRVCKIASAMKKPLQNGLLMMAWLCASGRKVNM